MKIDEFSVPIFIFISWQVSMGHVLRVPYSFVDLQEVLNSLLEADVALWAFSDHGDHLDELPEIHHRWLCLLGTELPDTCRPVSIKAAVHLPLVVSGSILLNGFAERDGVRKGRQQSCSLRNRSLEML